ncbi:hypothetical protein [Sneathia sanguinegens]|uniref:hypothetical protein n=1 Tax=Sneathia sanguinegens TaxID=40543 RepID=UPI0023F74789|nr:hypothetical protein [Sneathia sanguinegens]
MLLFVIIISCSILFILCILKTGTDEKNLKNYGSYPDEVQRQIELIEEYKGKFKKKGKFTTWILNFFLFTIIFFFLGLFIRKTKFVYNFIQLIILGEILNVFDLVIIDLLWWRNTKRIRLSKIPQKELYQNPKKHIEAFKRAVLMYFFIVLLDGYILTLF